MIPLKDEKSWKINTLNSALVQFAQMFNMHPKMMSILASRGVNTYDKAKMFLCGGLEYLHNPFLFKGMKESADRIRKAIDLREEILVYGDRDVDGITAVNIIVNSIRLLGGNVQWYVPADEGYGIHKDILSKYVANNVKVLITVDCGISAKEEIEYAKTLGIDVILTDHHEPPCEGLPKSFSIIDPKLSDTIYPFKDIAGCAVALKTAQAVTLTFGREYNRKMLLFNALKNDNGFNGEFVWLCNDLEIERGTFETIDELRKMIKEAFRVYTFSVAARQYLIEKDVLLRDKVILFTDNNDNDMKSLISRKIKLSNEDSRMKDFFESNLDLCALGTIADSMPLIDENRIIVREGLKLISSNPHIRPGLGLLIEDTLKTKTSYNVTAQSISWNVTPVLNSSGRMGRGTLSAQLLMTKDKFQAENLYSDIVKLNAERRWLQFENIGQFKALLKEQCDPDNDKLIVVKASNLEHGVTGIIASHMVKAYSKPAFLLISDGNEAIGAARSIEGFNIIAALESVKDILVKYGGHTQAAGFTVVHDKIDEFKTRILDYAEKNICKTDMTCNTINIECELKISDINIDFYNQLEKLNPFGMGNLRPIFCIKGVNITEIYIFGNRKEHLKFKVSQKGSRNVQAVFWNKAMYANVLKSEDYIDIAFHLDLADKNGEQITQLTVVDMKDAL